MKVAEFAKKAVEGGWKPHYIDVKHSDHWYGASEDSSICIPQMLLDVEAWQAVGKVEGWEQSDEETQRKYFNPLIKCNGHTLYLWHGMIDALAEGKTIEQYLETL